MSETRVIQQATKEAPLWQGEGESIIYTLTTTPWGSSPGSVVVKVYEVAEGAYTDVSSTKLTGSASVSGDIITLPALASLEAGKVYRLEVAFVAGGNTFECYGFIEGER